jgi:signal transduction histidine kinase
VPTDPVDSLIGKLTGNPAGKFADDFASGVFRTQRHLKIVPCIVSSPLVVIFGAQALYSTVRSGLRARIGRATRLPIKRAFRGRAPARHRPADSDPGTNRGGASTSRWLRFASIKDWRLRSRLTLIVAAPLLLALVFGGVSVSSSVHSERDYQRVQQLADLAGDITRLVGALQDERQDVLTFIVMADQGGRASALSASSAQRASAAPELGLVGSDVRDTDVWAARVRSRAAALGVAYPALVRQLATSAITAIDDLPALRHTAMGSMIPGLSVINYYNATITQLLALESEVAAGSNNAALADNVRVLGLISNIKEDTAGQQAIVTTALRPDLVGANQLGAESLSALNQDAAEQEASLTDFNLTATDTQSQLYNSAMSSPQAATAQQQLQQAESLLASRATSASDPTLAVAAEDASFITGDLGSVERQLISSIISQSGSLRTRAADSAAFEAIAVLLMLTLALLLIVFVGQSMTGPLRRLRSGALEVAGVRLPEMVLRIGETGGEGVPLQVEPIDVHSADEIGEVARAFDQVHEEAVRLAANEAALRGNVNAMFVNLSRRSQSLVERLIRLITRLELGEQDSERLANLFEMDHLVTRLRRNSENLLVLASHDLSRRSARAVKLVDVLRAALSEIEQYERVTLNVQPGIAVGRQAVRDVVHLTAELLENATSFSAADTGVSIAANLLPSGGALIEITDRGVGMSAEEITQTNQRLDNPPVVDVAASRRMGLFVVARLASRHGIRVRLRSAPSGGLSALVWLPDEAITHETGPPARPRVVQGLEQDRAASPVTTSSAPSFAAFRRASDEPSSSRSSPDGTVRADGSWAVTRPLPRVERYPHEARPARDIGPTGREPPRKSVVGQIDRTWSREVDAIYGIETDTPAGVNGTPEGAQTNRPRDEVVVPPANGTEGEYRLPIFEAVESDWFSRGRQAISRSGQGGNGWSSPSDEGWRAAEAAHDPSSDGTTTAGLPKRQPRANLVPGTVTASPAPSSTPRPKARSAAQARERFASFQRGVRQGRAAASSKRAKGGKAGVHDQT